MTCKVKWELNFDWDRYAADGPANFEIVSGPKCAWPGLLVTILTVTSMSGKSTYLRQIGLLTVQAMLGCL